MSSRDVDVIVNGLFIEFKSTESFVDAWIYIMLVLRVVILCDKVDDTWFTILFNLTT